jgi:hypothetical protein
VSIASIDMEHFSPKLDVWSVHTDKMCMSLVFTTFVASPHKVIALCLSMNFYFQMCRQARHLVVEIYFRI